MRGHEGILIASSFKSWEMEKSSWIFSACIPKGAQRGCGNVSRKINGHVAGGGLEGNENQWGPSICIRNIFLAVVIKEVSFF